ncbi:MAG: hypothetical protein ACLTKI_06520 [Lachnospiraceae bacterium]
MARALAQFPNRFRSLDQISEYMLSCLASCSDQAEKETSKELISDLMELENAFL